MHYILDHKTGLLCKDAGHARLLSDTTGVIELYTWAEEMPKH